MVKRTTRSSTSPGLSTRRRHGVSMGLMMECQDDDLSPSQIDYMRKCRLEYDKAMAMIKEAQTKARLGKATVSIQKNAGKVPQVMPISSSNAATPKQQNTQKEMPNRSTSPDVIIVGETPATPKSTVPVAAAKTRVPVPVARPPAGLTPQQIVVRPLQNTQPARLPQTVLKVIPVTSQPLQFGYPQPQTLVSQQQATVRPTYNQRFIASQNSASSMLLNSALQAKRNLDNMQDSDGPLRKKQKKVDTNEVGNWVPLDEYYYGKMEGDPSYVEEKGEFRFKCWYCSKMLYNNVKAMMHIQGHIDSGKQHNLDLSDLTQCKHCYKQFDTPFEMQTHVEKVHMNGANVLLCRICERDHESRNALTHHMRQNHTACEMPYICQLCSFRSSMYSDVVDHFKKKHDSSQHILCLYCLKIFKVKFVTQGWGQTQTYYGHLLKHQSKTATRKCTLCRLTFFNTGEVKSHKKKDHTANHKGILGTNNRYTTPGQVMIKVPESGLHGKQQSLKSLNAPTVSKILDFGGTRFPTVVNYLTCLECKMSMGTPDHFKKHIECSMCRFATSCSIAYANHMMGFHSGQMSSLNLNIPWERRMESPMYCLCGFSSRYGNRIANHLVYCTKRTCYRSKQHTPGEEGTSDEEVGDPRRKPGASLLDVLGLVKKRTIATKIRRGSKEEDRSIPPFRVNPGKVRSEASGETEDSTVALPKEETSPVSTGAPDVDNTPPELKGSRKWKTVKIKDQEIPSKASVFLGAKKEPKNEDDDEMENEETEDLCTEKDDSREVNPDIVKSSNVSPNNEEETMELDHNTSKSSVNDKDKDLKITAVFDDDDDNDDVKSLGKEEIDELLKETSDTSDMVVDDAVDKEKTDVDKEEKVDVSSRAEDVTNTSESTGNAGNETIENTADDKEKEDEQLPLVTEAVSDEVEQSAMSKTSDTVQEQSTECQPESEKEETEDEKISEVVAMETNTQDSEEDSGERGMHESSVTVDNHVQDKSKEEISAELEKSEECSSQTQEESTAEIPESLEKSEESTSQMQEKITEIVSEASEKSESSSSLMQEKSTEDISEASEKSESSSSLMQEKSTEDISEELEKSEESSHVQEKCMDEVSEVLEKSEESSSQIEEKSEESSSQMEEKSEEPTTEPPAQKTEKETEEQLEKISDKKRSDEMNERGDDINRELNKKSEVKSDDTKIQERTVVKENVKERSPDKGERSGERSSSTNRHNSEDRGPGSKSDSRGPRGDSRFDHHHGDRSHNYYEKRSHDSRYGSGSHRDDGRSHNRYQHEDRSYDYKRGQDYQRDKYHGGSYNDRRDNRGYQDNRNYHGNHPYGNRGRDDRRRDGHYDNYNRNQGQYNRGGRGGYGYRGGYQGSYR